MDNYTSRKLERIIFRNKLIDIKEFPPLSKEDENAQMLESLSFDYRMGNICFLYIRSYESDNWFVDIYYYFESGNRIECRRLVIAPNMMMTERDERLLYHLVMCEDILFSNYDKFMSEIEQVKSLKMKPYQDIGLALFHTYFAAHKSGVRNELIKIQGVEQISLYLHEISGWNMIATRLKDLFQEQLPLGLLRKLNSYNSIMTILATKKGRQNAVTVYKQYHSLLNDVSELNEFQIQYMLDCSKQKIKINKRFLKYLSELESRYDYEVDAYVDGFVVYKQLIEYQKLYGKIKRKYNKISFPQYPNYTDYDRFYELLHLLKKYVNNENVDEVMADYCKKVTKKYSYRDDVYSIIVPKTPIDVLDESGQQHNCLYQCIDEIICGEKTIVFMRENLNPQKSLVTIEIEEDSFISQAKGFGNRKVSDSEKEFLFKFAKEKSLVYV